MPLNVNEMSSPSILQPLDNLLITKNTKIWSMAVNETTAKSILKSLRKQDKPWFLTITPVIDYTQERSKHVVRLTAITDTDIVDNPVAKLSKSYDNWDVNKFTGDLMLANKLPIKSLYFEQDGLSDNATETPLKNQLFQNLNPQLQAAVTIVLEVLIQNPSLIRTNLDSIPSLANVQMSPKDLEPTNSNSKSTLDDDLTMYGMALISKNDDIAPYQKAIDIIKNAVDKNYQSVVIIYDCDDIYFHAMIPTYANPNVTTKHYNQIVDYNNQLFRLYPKINIYFSKFTYSTDHDLILKKLEKQKW